MVDGNFNQMVLFIFDNKKYEPWEMSSHMLVITTETQKSL